jgi:peptide-methionine (S)-S-oxide reductase
MSCLTTLKTYALAALIVLGLTVQAKHANASDLETLTVAGGCFWCVEADFEQVRGVTGAVSGFIGGAVANPTYEQVTGGNTGHYEAVQITFDPSVVTAQSLLTLFFRSIDPTDAGGQFCDRGSSYRTAIFADGPAQLAAAQAAKQQAQTELGQSIVTPVLGIAPFYPADDYHQDFYKGTKVILTRGGPKRQASAYKFYREGCGRDARVKELWGPSAPFVGG